MEDKTKLYVFEKKEVALIFVFMLLIALTSFILGIKIGKNYSFRAADLTQDDRQRVELLSSEEEMVNKVVDDKKAGGAHKEGDLKDMAFEKLKDKINSEFAEEETTQEAKKSPSMPSEVMKKDSSEKVDQSMPMNEAMQENEDEAKSDKSSDEQTPKDQYSGKYTIQLGSHRAMADAEKFADGFRIRGYNPIITEVNLKNRGTWFRVSLGAFSSITEAKDYVIKEKTLFEGIDYVIGRFD